MRWRQSKRKKACIGNHKCIFLSNINLLVHKIVSLFVIIATAESLEHTSICLICCFSCLLLSTDTTLILDGYRCVCARVYLYKWWFKCNTKLSFIRSPPAPSTSRSSLNDDSRQSFSFFVRSFICTSIHSFIGSIRSDYIYLFIVTIIFLLFYFSSANLLFFSGVASSFPCLFSSRLSSLAAKQKYPHSTTKYWYVV